MAPWRPGARPHDALAEFSGGALFVDLTPIREPDQVVAEVATVLGASIESGRPPLDAVVESIGRCRVLLLLDNFEQITPAAPVAARLVERCPRLTVMVTSRVVPSLQDEIAFSGGAIAPASGADA